VSPNAFEKLRQTRVLKRVTLKDLAKKADLSYRYISQIERGDASPSLSSLARLAGALELDIWELLKDNPDADKLAAYAAVQTAAAEERPEVPRADNEDASPRKPRKTKVVRSDMRRSIILPQSSVQYQMITPDINSKLQVILIKADTGSTSGEAPFEHDGEECFLMLEGEVEMTLGDEVFSLGPGDSLYFACDQPHLWRNTGEGPVSMLLVVTPPAY